MSVQYKKAFTIIELVVIIAIIAVLALLSIPQFMNYTREAEFTRLTHDARLLEDACEQYYLAHGDWPRASDTPYTAEQVNTFAQKVYDRTGKVIVLDPEGKYYDIDMQKLGRYVTINSDPRNFVLQNPVGSVYILDPQTNIKLQEPKTVQKPVAVIIMTPDQNLTTTTKITWDYSQSYDPNGYAIVNAEWEGKQDQYTAEGEYTVKLRVQNSKGIWSDWASITFYVEEGTVKYAIMYDFDQLPEKIDPNCVVGGSVSYRTISDGMLHIKSSGVCCDYDILDRKLSPTDKVIVETKVKVVSNSNGYEPTIMIRDGQYGAILQLYTNQIKFLGAKTIIFPIDMTVFHKIVFIKENISQYSLYVDDKLLLDKQEGNTTDYNSHLNRITFGNTSSWGSGESYWDYFGYKVIDTTIK